MRRVTIVLTVIIIVSTATTTIGGKPGPGGHERELGGIITVAREGAHFETVSEALDYLATVAPPPSAVNPFVVRIGPGIYEERVEMMEWVNIEGSGRDATIISAEGADDFGSAYTVLGADHAELSRLTIINRGYGVSYANGFVCDGTSPTLRDLKIVAAGATSIARGVYADNSDVVLDDVVIEAVDGRSVGAFRSNYGTPSLTRVDASAHGATDDAYGVGFGFAAGIVTIADSRIAAGSGAEIGAEGIQVDRSAGVLLDGVSVTTSAAVRSWGMSLLEADDVVVRDSTFDASGGGIGYGIRDSGGAPAPVVREITNSTVHGDQASIFLQVANVFHIGASRLSGPVTSYMGGAAKCVASFDHDFEPLTEHCESLTPPTPTPTPTAPPMTPTPTPTSTTTVTVTLTPTWTMTPTPTVP